MENNNIAVGETLEQYSSVEDNQEYEPSTEEAIEYEEPAEEVIEEPAPSSYMIDGEEVDIDTIRAWKNGNMRQSDYTRKTQEVAAERERLKEASTIYDYLKNNPDVVRAIREAENNPAVTNALPSAEKDAIQQMRIELQSMKIDNKVRELHDKYGNFDEDTLFKTANERGVTDLEIVLQSMLYNNGTNKNAIEAAKKELLEEIEANKEGTKTIVKNTAKKPQQKASLSAAEKRVARGMGLSESDYIKWKG